MDEIQKDIVNWHKKTFPNATDEALNDKLAEESLELLEALVLGQGDVVEEIADVFIVSCTFLDRHGLSFADFVAKKMEINKKREWGEEVKNGDRPRKR